MCYLLFLSFTNTYKLIIKYNKKSLIQKQKVIYVNIHTTNIESEDIRYALRRLLECHYILLYSLFFITKII